MKRREFLIRSSMGLSALQLAGPVSARPVFSASPFSLGIASGDVTDSSVVLWTRLAPAPLEMDGGIGQFTIPVSWTLAQDPAMKNIIQRGESHAAPQLAHSVHVDIEGLTSNAEYWYQFSAGNYQSEVGRTRTLPAINEDIDSIRFITASCQNYSHGYFIAYEHMVADKPDFIIHLGDYIYDTSFGETFRQHETEKAPVSLADYRRRHALYKTDKHLQHAHAQIPFFTTIDNHDAIEDRDPDKFAQRAAAYQAWYEHMPVRGYGAIGDNRFDLQRKISLGDLVQISLLDSRQFRDKKDLCRDSMDPNYGFGNYRERCSDLISEDRSMLGLAQERWLEDSLLQNKAAWNVIASPGPFLPFRYYVDGKELSYIGAWDAYPANRQRIADTLNATKSGHPIILSGDVHSFWAVDGQLIKDQAERLSVVEFVTSSITANWPLPLAKPVTDNLTNNPQVKFYEPDKRGYLLHEVNSTEWKTTARAMRDVRDEQSQAFSLASFLVNNGKAGFKQLF
ncbi:MAG: alkaline phosphatase D [Gammaproteobacteria bacterium]|jgi:alkaline phosphatase D